MGTPYLIPLHLPQPFRLESDGSPTWRLSDGTSTWTNKNWNCPLERLPEYLGIVPPLPPEPEVIPSITPAQLRIALSRIGITEAMLNAAVDVVINAAPPEIQSDARILWEWATVIQRNYPTRQDSLISRTGQVLQMTDEQIDELFRQASRIYA